MPDLPQATYRFFSWLRQGLLADLSNVGGSPATNAGRLEYPVRLRVNDGQPVDIDAQLYGPGDVTGLDAREVIRLEPPRFMTDFEPNYFPSIEFDRPDFPWLFTPANADGNRRLLPWICLIVVKKEGATLTTDAGKPLSVLECPRGELPNLEESWAWAHAQIVSSDQAPPDPSPHPALKQILNQHPERTLSRLLSPRRLDPNTAYYACLVPTFEVGLKTGLGEAVTPEEEQAMKAAWSASSGAGTTATLTLPVYFHWEFRTGIEGDFESLARRIEAKPLPETIGLRQLDISAPGWGMPSKPRGSDGTVLDLEGALRTPETNPRDWPEPARTAFQNSLRTILNIPASLNSTGTPATLGPPLYGQWYAKQETVPAASQPPHWFRELNSDPRYRVAAGLGTYVVQQDQEQLMASAWDQLEKKKQDNLRLKRAQLAETVGGSLVKKHLASLDPSRLLQFAGPTLGSLKDLAPPAGLPSDPRRLVGHAALSGTFRRFNRPRGPLATRLGHIDAARLSNQIPAPFSRREADTSRLFAAATLSETHRRIQLAADWAGLKANILTQLDPKATVLTAVRETVPSAESIDVALFAPTFPQPMYEPMRDAFPDMLLPGMDQVPANSIALLQTNPSFIEAYMVGLNHEMSRELLWRGFPTDQRGTYFRQFWDAQGDLLEGSEQEREARRDITAIATWSDESHLGSHGAQGSSEGQLVLLIRGDLLRRYPRAMVYAVEGIWSADGTRRELGTNELYPMFRATQAPDTTMLGFALTKSIVRGADNSQNSGHPGWFFVLQEQPTEPRFGLDVAKTFGGTPDHWSDLSWGNLASSEETFKQLVYVPIDGLLKNVVRDNILWGKNSAHMASITRQPPFRVAIHARTWLRT
ncbi:MAG: hypothetical protein H8K03_09935 [Nitrospira sp.]|jgi:hypothetical protein|nr:hypothetical protein [Nitrospira sp. BO4]